ncbi:hypothetical protein JTB14_036673 [Gonioctena quinquepunctata]|nr:hypothetical protein JTB14_036673 [Gonioctena quinquepunctata]
MKSLVSPKKPEEATLAEVVILLKNHFDPEKLEIAETFNFNNYIQKSNQSVAEFVVELKELARSCNFEEFLNRALHKAVSIATSCEWAELQVKTFQPECGVNKLRNHEKSNAVSKPSVSNPNGKSEVVSKPKPCFRCGRIHNPATCPAEQCTCFSCRKRRHTSTVCKQKGKVNNVEEQSLSDENDHEEEEFLAHLSCNKLNLSEKAGMSVNGQFLQMEVDSGAARSVISEIQFKEMFPKAPILPVKVDLSVITGQSVTVVGESILPLLVIQSLTKFTPLMGRDWLDSLCPNWQGNL